MNNQPPKQLMVIPGAIANQNQHTTPVALLDETGAPLSLASGFTAGDKFTYQYLNAALTLQQTDLDFADWDLDPGGWYDVEALVLPVGTYQIDVDGVMYNGTPASDDWAVRISLLSATLTSKLIAPRLLDPAGNSEVALKSIIHLVEPTSVFGRVYRNGIVSANVAVNISIQKL